MINPLGFTLEQFDAIGRFRKTENDQPIDAAGNYVTRTGETLSIEGARDLANFLANSDEAYDAFVQQLFHHIVKQPIRAYGRDSMRDLKQSFVDSDFNVYKLLIDCVATSALPAECSENN
jgi:hypothetical protein